jgi:mycothiol synthase
MNTLPQGFQLRHPTMDDLQGVTDLLIACNIADYGYPISARSLVEESTRSSWKSPSIDLATNAWVVLAPNGQHIARLGVSMSPEKSEIMYASPRVHPDYRGLGIGTFLLRLAEQRARELMASLPQEKRVTLNSWVEGVNEDAKTLLTREGFSPLRTFFRMEINMDEAPPTPQWPTEIMVRTFVQGQDERLVYEADEEIFQDHWGYTPTSFDEWVRSGTEMATFDPSLWFLAMAANEIAGYSLCLLNVGEQVNMGFVDDLGVRRPWRKHGLGLALLHYSFGEFYKRGIRHVELSVDSDNLSGATRLYERAGMRRAKKYDVRYEKVLREG